MCVSPVKIRNPNYHNKSRLISKLCDTESEFIKVPCGHCSECIAVRQMSVVQRCQMEELNNHLFFCTLTYNNDSMPILGTSTGFDIRYADVRDVQNMMKRIRKGNLFGRKFKYLAVSELGSKRARPHFHIIFSIEKFLGDKFNDVLNLESVCFNVVLSQWKRNYGTNFNPIWKPCCTYVCRVVRGRVNRTFDFHYMNPRTGSGDICDVPFYVTKYMMKPSDREQRLQQALKMNLSEDEYERTWSIVRSRYFSSLHFGYDGQDNVKKYIRDCVAKSRLYEDSPKFYNPYNGQSFPLSRYFMNIGDLYGVDDALVFNDKRNLKDNVIDNVVIDDRSITEKLLSIEKFSHNVDLVDSKDQSFVFDDLLD